MSAGRAALPMSRAKSPPVPARPFSRLHEICGGLMEACWLAAVVLVPLAYNPHGIAAFQPFKMACFRLLAAIIHGQTFQLMFKGDGTDLVKAFGKDH